MAEIISRAGLPVGAFNLVMGRGSVVGEAIISDPRVDAISFTGSVDTGRRVAAACAARMAKFQLEMGGKNPFVVLDDADLNVAVSCAINSGFFSTGQRCTASSRVVVTAGIHDRFVAAMVERMKSLKIVDARKAGTDIGPVVDERQLAQDLEYIDIGKKEGARLAAGGQAIERNSAGAPGHYLMPALFTDTAASRLIVTEGIHDRFVEALGKRMAALTIDDALKAGTDIGPVVDQSQLEQDLRYVEIAKSEGGKVVAGGERLKRGTEGFYLAPALITETTPTMRINREEVFGPVASVIRVKDYDEALAVVNDTTFGLTAGIATRSLKHAAHFKRNANVGMVMVNLPTAGVDYHVPFGGRKGSSYGPREQGPAARDFYTRTVTVTLTP
jgi:acyl-CoA reductase-like NAD-dependent aldehyde dehydrogenase